MESGNGMTNAQFTALRLLCLALIAVLLYTAFVHHPMADPNPQPTHCGSDFDYDQYQACRERQSTTTTSTLK